MKKSIIPKIIFGILTIILIVAIIFAITHKEKDLTIKMYNDICQKENYTFSMKEENMDVNYTLTISKKNQDMSIETKSDEDHTTTLKKDGIAFYVMHNEKEYYQYDGSEVDADILENGLSEIDQKKYVKGHEKINGKSYYYEEYEDIGAFFIMSKYNEEDKIKTKFYFDNGKIAYIKTTSGENKELLKIEFSDNIDEKSFEIPDDYAEL